MENGSLVEPTMIRPGGPDLNSSLIDMPELNQRSNNLSVYHRERSRIVEPSRNQREKGQPAINAFQVNGSSAQTYNEPPTRTYQYHRSPPPPSADDYQSAENARLLAGELDRLKERIRQVELENTQLRTAQTASLAAKPPSQMVSIEAYLRLQKELEAERSQRLSSLSELHSLRSEVDSLRFINSKLESEKQAYLKAFADLKKQRDQTGVQRMQIIAIRNFLVAVELERITVLYLEKQKECEDAKVAG